MAQMMATMQDDMNHAALAAAGAGNQALCGVQGSEWNTEDPKDPNIIEKAKFSVEEKNKELGCQKFVFVSVTSAQSKTGAGVNYRLTISLKDCNKPDSYDAGVFHAFDGTKTLEYFVRVP